MKILGSQKSYSCEINQTKQTNTPSPFTFSILRSLTPKLSNGAYFYLFVLGLLHI